MANNVNPLFAIVFVLYFPEHVRHIVNSGRLAFDEDSGVD